MAPQHPLSDLVLNDGHRMPIIGLGTYEAPKGETEQVVSWAIDLGYRHFDCAAFYENEDEVGRAINAAIRGGKVKREELFITTKVWPNWVGPGRATQSVKRSLRDLGLDYVDLALIHWPTPFKQVDNEWYPNVNGDIVLDESINLVDVWREFEQIKAQGLAKSIGVSNFNSQQVQMLIDGSKTVPVVNQVESHPYLSNGKLLEWSRAKGIHLTAYSPLARTGTAEKKNTTSPLVDSVVVEIAQAHHVTPAQVCIRWQAQRGVAVIPKSARRERLASNFDIFGFELTSEEMDKMNRLNRDWRNNTWCQYNINKSPLWPFGIPY